MPKMPALVPADVVVSQSVGNLVLSLASRYYFITRVPPQSELCGKLQASRRLSASILPVGTWPRLGS